MRSGCDDQRPIVSVSNSGVDDLVAPDWRGHGHCPVDTERSTDAWRSIAKTERADLVVNANTVLVNVTAVSARNPRIPSVVDVSVNC